MVLVADELIEPWSMLTAIHAVERMAPERIVVAAPVATDAAVAAVRTTDGHPHDVIVLHRLRPYIEGSAAYRDYADPSNDALTALLRRPPAKVA